jgi:N-acyl-L-homoserine lactone synthetase
MIVVIEGHNATAYSTLLTEMFRLRARIFRERRGWDVQVNEQGEERDKYDDPQLGPTYIIVTDEEARTVKGSVRLLPTTGPTVHDEIFSGAAHDATRLSAPTIWECNRLCFDESLELGNWKELFSVARTLLAAVGDVSLKAGIECLTGDFDNVMLRVYRRLGFEVEILATTTKYGAPVHAALVPISSQIIERSKQKLTEMQAAM